MTVAALVERERRHLHRAEIATALLLVLGAVAGIAGLAAVTLGRARWLVLPRALPFVAWLLAACAVAVLLLRTRRRLSCRGSARDVALAIEREQGLRRGLLVGALELEGTGPLAARAAAAAHARLPQNAPLAPALRRSSSRAALAGGGLAAAGIVLLLSATPLFADGLRAVLRPVDAWRGALLDPPRIEGAPRELVRGAPVQLVVRAAGRSRIFLAVRQTGDARRVDTLVVDARTGLARWGLESLHGDLALVASDGRATSDSVVVHAVDRPFVGAVTLRVDYPAYLARPAETLPVGEPLRLPRGTMLAIAGRASVPLTRVTLEQGGDARQLATSGHVFAGRFLVAQSMQLRWRAWSADGEVADVPPPLDITVLADAVPLVEIRAPVADTILATEDAVGLHLAVTDDHGIADVVLRTTRVGGAAHGTSTTRAVASGAGASWEGTAGVDIGALALQPGETARVRAEAVDASPWRQRGVSREVVIRRPTMEQRRDVARALGDSAVAEARAMALAQRSLAQRTGEAARAQERAGAARGPESPAAAQGETRGAGMKFESAEKARGLAREQRAMADRVQKLRDATQQLERQLKATGALDSSLARQLGEAQAMLRQALTPELAAQMQKLERAAQAMDGQQSREAMRDLARLQQQMREQLERSAEILKRAAHEGAMQTMADQARELAQRERALADAARVDPGSATVPREAAAMAQQAGRLAEQMAALEQRLAKDRAEAGASRTGEAREHATRSQAEMQRAASQGESSPQQGQGAEARAREGAAAMERAAASMQDARAAQVKDWKRELTAELDQSVQEMMQLAREERALERQARARKAGDDQRGAQSAVEQGVDKAAERLTGAAKKSALLSSRSQRAVAEARDKVSEATRRVAQPSSGTGGQQQANALGEAADALTRAAAALARDRQRANAASSASGFAEMMQELQQAAQRQGQINGQAQSLLSMPGGQAGEAGQSLSRALARQQRAVADQLDDAGDAAGGERAAQLAREARQLADRLDGGRLDAGTLARQQQLFRRLLDAGRSLEKEERDDSGKREAIAARGAAAFTPGDAAAARAGIRFRPPTWDELRGLGAEERRAILDYFARLNDAAPR